MAVGLLTIQDPYFTLNPYIMLHKFSILLLTINIAVATTIRSQTLEDRIKLSYSPLQPYTQTGILLDRSPLKYIMVDSLAPEFYYPGSPIVGTQFRFESLYNLFYHASFTGAPFVRHPASLPYLIDSLRLGFDESSISWPQIDTMATFCDVVMGSLMLKYQKIKSNAFDEGWVHYDKISDRFYLQLAPYSITDTLWLSGQPGSGSYIIHNQTIFPDSTQTLSEWNTYEELFVFSALTTNVVIDSNAPVRFYFPSILNLSNYINYQLEVDFDDGNSFVLIDPGQLKLVNYSSSGLKTIRARIRNSNGQLIGDLPTLAHVRIIKSRYSPDLVLLSSNFIECNVGQVEGFGDAKLSFKLASSSNGKLTRPFILVEGFESSEFSKTNPEMDIKTGNGYGAMNWISFTSGMDPEIYPQMIRLPQVVDSLLDIGYDVGFVDFRTNRAQIEKNSNTLINLLIEVQSTLNKNSSDYGIQLMGASMGGLIARMAIVKMEKNNCCHSVKTYYSFSTPHQGANLPIAAQHLTYDLGNKFNFLNLLDRSKLAYSQVLNSPAARQLLKIHRENSARSEHNSFFQTLQQLGYPTLTKNIAITDGSLNGFLHRLDNSNLSSPLLTELQNIFQYNLRIKSPSNVQTIFDAPVTYFTLSTAVGNSIQHSPLSTSNSWIYKHGRSIENNMSDYFDLWKVLIIAKYNIRQIKILHNNAMIFFPQYTAQLIASRTILINRVTYSANTEMLDLNQSNSVLNQSYTFEYLTNPSEGLDNAPGDYGNIVKDIVQPFNEISQGFAFSNVFPTSSFVSTVSAIDEPISTRTVLINQNQNVSLTKFDYAWAKLDLGKNEYYNNVHITISDEFIKWLLGSLKSLNSPQKNIINELVLEDFNIGFPESTVLQEVENYFHHESFPSVKIRKFSTLYFNRMLPIGYSNFSNITLPKINSAIHCQSRNLNCTPVIIQNEGTIELGEPSSSAYSNTAHVQFRSGSVLELFSNSTLNIHQGSRLTIDSGATLIIHPNANVFLEGNNSVLEIKGKVVLLPTSVFELTGAGYLLVNQDSSQVAHIFDLWEAQGPATIKFHGLQASQRLMELASIIRLSPRIKFDFQQGRIVMHEAVMLDFNGDLELRNLHIQAATNQPHRGIYLHGQANVLLTNLTINGAEKGITSTMIQYRNPLVLNQCNLSHNYSAVTTYGGQVNFQGTIFSGNTTAWMAYDMDGNSQISECQFTSNDVGIDIMGQHDANLNITQTIIEQNVWGIKSFGQLYCRMNCSSVSNNTTGIYAGNYQWLIGGRSRNKFQNNQLAIRLEEVDNLFLFEGENDFSGSQMYISGMFSGIAMNYLSLNPITNAYELNVKDNRMPVVAGNTRVHLRDWDYNPVYLQNHAPMPPYMQLCEASQTVAFEDHVLQNWHSNIKVNVGGNQLPLNEAVDMARSYITTNELQNTKLDLDALILFDEILSQVRMFDLQTALTSNDIVVLEIALNKMMEAHNNAYRFELIPRVRAVDELPKNSYLTAILNEIDHRIGLEVINPSSERSLNSLVLTKAQLFRTAEHYDYAIETLQELKVATDPYWSATGDYWECICNAEQQLIRETIEAEVFEAIRLECRLLGPQERRKQPALEGDMVQLTKNTPNYFLFPNPTNNTFYVRSDVLVGSAAIRIVDLTGRVVKTAIWADRGDLLEMDVQSLKSGIYAIVFSTDNQAEVIRFTKF